MPPGIGSGHNSRSSVTIKSGTVNATGNGTGAGIGGSYADVTISGGNITATGYDTGAGIGGSYSGDSSKITITGGTITATGTSDAPAIGNGSVSISNTGVENAGAELDITATAPTPPMPSKATTARRWTRSSASWKTARRAS